MSRIKRGKIHLKRRKNLLKKVKGYQWGRKKLIKQARTAVRKAGQHSFMGRKKKKGDFRRLWQIKISAFCQDNGTSYSKFIGALKKNKIELDRKILADLSEHNPLVMKAILEKVK